MKPRFAYWLIHDDVIFDRNERLFMPEKVENLEFDQEKILFGRGKMGNYWPKDVRIHLTGSQPVDFLMCTPWLDIISDRAKHVILQKTDWEAEFLPVQIVLEDGALFTDFPYWVIYVVNILDPLDWENTRWTEPTPPKHDDPYATMRIIKPAFREAAIKDHFIFRIEVNGRVKPSRYVTLPLKKALQKAGCAVGMDFCPLTTTQDVQ